MKIAIIGATGLVGGVMLETLGKRSLNGQELLLAASAKSVGKSIETGGRKFQVQSLDQVLDAQPQIALFSAGGAASREWAPRFAGMGCFVIDNSSAWRMEENVPLVVPEINSQQISRDTKIIANPNCSTIQMVLALHALDKRYGLKRLVISTYQSVTGTGVKAVEQLTLERSGQAVESPAYEYKIDLNCLPKGGDFLENGYTTEEMKLVNETRKILDRPDLSITATVVRIPTFGGHSESINVELQNDFDLKELRQVIGSTSGIELQDEPHNNIFPMPLTAEGKDEVFVGRIRRDFSKANSLNMWVVSDNLRKGAATNAVQIAEHLVLEGLVTA